MSDRFVCLNSRCAAHRDRRTFRFANDVANPSCERCKQPVRRVDEKMATRDASPRKVLYYTTGVAVAAGLFTSGNHALQHLPAINWKMLMTFVNVYIEARRPQMVAAPSAEALGQSGIVAACNLLQCLIEARHVREIIADPSSQDPSIRAEYSNILQNKQASSKELFGIYENAVLAITKLPKQQALQIVAQGTTARPFINNQFLQNRAKQLLQEEVREVLDGKKRSDWFVAFEKAAESFR